MFAVPTSEDRPPVGGQPLGEMDRGDGYVLERRLGVGIEMETGVLTIDEDLKIAECGPLLRRGIGAFA